MALYHVITFGCQMNQHDSDRIADVLQEAGYRPSPDLTSADLVLLNTCSVREKAEQKLRSEVGRLGKLKQRRPGMMIAVAGCVAQQEGQRLIKSLPQIDVVIGPDQAAALPRLLAEVEQGGLPQVQTTFDLDEPRFLSASLTSAATSLRSRKVTDFVTVMKGCDERCTFCVVPTTRGPERYRPSDEIISEVCRLVDAGTREITLLGQTVDSYLDPLGHLPRAIPPSPEPATGSRSAPRSRRDETEFPELLRAISRAAPGLARLRYTSPHPRHLTPALIEAHRELSVLARHVHMPVQSGSDRMLKRMSRRYRVDEYIERIEALRSAVPGLTLSTDIIVGFPGETEADFAATLDLVQRIGFVGVFGFKYSPRPFTPALKLGDTVAEADKAARLARLFALADGIKRAHLGELVGTHQEVLVEGVGQRGGYTGRTARNEIVHFHADPDPTGEVLEVRVERAFNNSLSATPVANKWLPTTAMPMAAAPLPRLLPIVT